MKKLVILSAFLSPYRSGAEAMVEEVSVRLEEKFDVTIITARLSRQLPRLTMLGKNVKVIRVGFGVPFDKWLYPFLAPMKAASLHPDIIHAVLETFAGLALYFCRCRAQKILTLQTTNRTFLKGMILRYPDTVTAISSALVKNAASYGRSDVILIPNGIDLAGIRAACQSAPKDSGRILFVGRLESMKGVDTLLQAFSLLISRYAPHPSVHLRIIGDGSKRVTLEKLAQTLEIDHRIRFTGYISGSELFTEYAKAEIFVGLSRSEAMGNVFLEAQAAGCCVLATRVGGIPDIVHDLQTGLLIPVDDAEAAALELKRVLTDASLRASLSIAAQKHASGFDWDAVAQRYAHLYFTATSSRIVSTHCPSSSLMSM